MRISRHFAATIRCLASASVFLASTACLRAASFNPEYGVGAWIWDHEVYDRQECRLVRAFQIPKGAAVKSAVLRITADNSYQLFLDGEYIGRGGDWRVLIEYDVSLLLGPGEHVLAVSALNDFDVAGLLFGLRIVLDDGSMIDIPSDDSWKVAPNDAVSWEVKTSAREHWPAATVERPFDPKALAGSRIYRAPVSRPVKIEIWQRGWFHLTLAAMVVFSLMIGLFLASRLVLKSQLERVVRRERARIAVDLHDGLGGGLTQLLLLGETSRREVQTSSAADGALGRQLCDQSRGLLQEMNEAVWLINSQRDTIRDLALYVAKYAETFFRLSAIRCRLEVEDDIPPSPCDLGIRRNLFLAVKEALNNLLRHSQATVAEVAVHRHRQELVVTIRDDGCGFDPAAESQGNGLRNMQLRAKEAGGRLTVKSSPGQGCTFEFRVPLAPERIKFSWFLPWFQRRKLFPRIF